MASKKALRKDFFMEIKKTYNRFLSICLIVALGTAFFAGIRATNPDMQESADTFFDETSLMDLRILSTLGLTDDDVTAISQIKGVRHAEPAYSADVLTSRDDEQLVLKLMSATDDVNLFTVDEGRMPQKANECFVDNLLIDNYDYKIGDTIKVISGDDTDIEDIVAIQEFKIVGCGRSSRYLNLTRDSSQIGHGIVNGFVVVPRDSFSMAAYTEIDLTIDQAMALNCYSDTYDTLIESVQKKIEDISDSRCEIRYAEIYDEAEEKIADAEQEVADAEAELVDAEQEISDGESELSDAIAEVEEGFQELADAQKTLDDKKSELVDGKVKIADGKTQIADAKAVIEEKTQSLNDTQAQLAEKEAELTKGQEQLDAGWKEYNDGVAVIASQKTELEKQQALLEAQAELLKTGREQLEAARPAVDEARLQVQQMQQSLGELNTNISALQTQLDNILAQMAVLKDRIDAGEIELQEEYQALEAQSMEISAMLEALNGQKNELQSYIDQATAQISEFDAKEQEIIAGETAVAEGRKAIEDGLKQLEQAALELEAGRSLLEEKQTELDAGAAQLADAKALVEGGWQQLDAAGKELADKEALLLGEEKKLADGERLLNEGQEEIDSNLKKLEDAEREISDNKEKLEDARIEYEDALEENIPKLEDARAEIADAKLELADLEMPEWYVLNRDYIQTCVEYAQDAERIGNIGKVFPVIFFLVAALISLTTMTRMVEEERIQIGTLKALGYSKKSIAAKYILYAFLATMIGGVAGTLIGQKLLPLVIMQAYGILYVTMNDFVTPYHMSYTVGALLAAVASTTIAVIAACYKELIAVPAELMRPEAPKIGKRVLLERVTFIWKRLNFSNKSAVRNLFRYKKRFFMTMIGIGGCMGLLLVGFGVKDSIMTIGDKQFNDLRIYHSEVTLGDDTADIERKQIYEEIMAEENVENAMFSHEETVDISSDASGKGERSSYLFVPSKMEQMDEFIVLRSRIGHKSYELSDDGVIISEKLASLLDVDEGDNIYIEISDMQRVPVKVEHIVENYFFHYTYLSPALYEKIYDKPVDYSKIFVKFKEPSLDYEKTFSGKYLEEDTVLGVGYTRTVSVTISNMIKSMDSVIYVIIISAGLLAFVVLYNLNNINISERKRELATLKVLGFYDREVSVYVFRENIMLTFFGAIAGIFFGIALHRFVILTAEIDLMMFGRSIYFKSYVYSIILTFAFSMIVNLVMYRKLKKIDMIESLKSVE